MTSINDDSTNSPKESSPFDNLDILQHIISFVGKNQYRFVAIINQNFQQVYLQLFPENRKTYFNTSTIEHISMKSDSASPLQNMVTNLFYNICVV
jgi:hypothetical protein